MKKIFLISTGTLLLFLIVAFCIKKNNANQHKIVSYIADPASQDICFFLNHDDDKKIHYIKSLEQLLNKKNKLLVFAMNGGMYDPEFNPVGLYIENHKEIKPINRVTVSDGSNFMTQPNGIFYIDLNNKAHLCKTADMVVDKKVKYATQSGPMLVVDGKINQKLSAKSTKLNTRNGVGILPDKRVLFAIAEKPVSMFDFAKFFKDAGCKNALFLDGGVSQIYWPEKNHYFGFGRLGVLIGITNRK